MLNKKQSIKADIASSKKGIYVKNMFDYTGNFFAYFALNLFMKSHRTA